MYSLVEENKGKYYSKDYNSESEALSAFKEMEQTIQKADLPYGLFVMEIKTGNVLIRNNNNKKNIGEL